MSFCDTKKYIMYGIYYNYIIPSIVGIAALSIIPPTFIYFRAYFTGKIKTIRSFFYMAALLFILIFFALIFVALHATQVCHNLKITPLLRHIAVQLFILQNMVLIGWFFQIGIHISRNIISFI